MSRGLLGCVVVAAIVIFLAVVVGVWFVGVRNHIVELDQAVDAQWAQVQNDYQRRFDLIPNLVQTVQGAANFEKSTLVEVTEARARVGQVTTGSTPGGAANIPNDPQAMQQFEQAQAGLSGALSRLLVVVERYPELKSNENFLQLQGQLEGTENRIAVERKRYNEKAQDYNTYILKFPASIVAGSRFPKKAYFQGTAGSSEPPKVQFDFGKK
ncbi:MAG TPA: LemA family protein [Thermoanaerobaculia bacterium]|nr:LemA family protein [Thermoanaerobaculia bacterium]